MKIIFLLIFTVLANSETENFFEANKLYINGDFEGASKIYEKLINSKTENGYLFYNLANSYFRLGELGKAIFYYRKALELLPRDADIKYNLEYVRQKTIDKIEKKTSLIDTFIRPTKSLNEKEAYILFFIFSFLTFLIFVIAIFYKRNFLKYVKTILILFTLFFAYVLNVKHFAKPFGVIIAEEVRVYSGVGIGNVVLFRVHQGTEFNINDSFESWRLIELSDGKKGWIESGYIF